ncbi:MAG: hypothetical protein JO208_08890 [Alphaproteobacteria bacterium]|nr:hypothetical protein [Alphaproteobacteria bacterium]
MKHKRKNRTLRASGSKLVKQGAGLFALSVRETTRPTKTVKKTTKGRRDYPRHVGDGVPRKARPTPKAGQRCVWTEKWCRKCPLGVCLKLPKDHPLAIQKTKDVEAAYAEWAASKEQAPENWAKHAYRKSHAGEMVRNPRTGAWERVWKYD